MNNKNIKKAGVILAVSIILKQLNTMRLNHSWSVEYLSIWSWIYIIVFIILAGACVFGENGSEVCFAAGSVALYEFVLSQVFKNFGIYSISHCLAYTLIFIGAMIVTLKQFEKWTPMILQVWFLPLILLIGSYIFENKLWEFRHLFKSEIFRSYFLVDFLFYTAFTYLCVGIGDAAAQVVGALPAVNPVCENQPVHPDVEAPVVYTEFSNASGADKIKAYMELLECGVITREEFEEKKKQILDQL